MKIYLNRSDDVSEDGEDASNRQPSINLNSAYFGISECPVCYGFEFFKKILYFADMMDCGIELYFPITKDDILLIDLIPSRGKNIFFAIAPRLSPVTNWKQIFEKSKEVEKNGKNTKL